MYFRRVKSVPKAAIYRGGGGVKNESFAATSVIKQEFFSSETAKNEHKMIAVIYSTMLGRGSMQWLFTKLVSVQCCLKEGFSVYPFFLRSKYHRVNGESHCGSVKLRLLAMTFYLMWVFNRLKHGVKMVTCK